MAPGMRVRRLIRRYSLRAAVKRPPGSADVNIHKNHLVNLPKP